MSTDLKLTWNYCYQDMFLRNNDELTKIITDCYTVNTYMQVFKA